MKYDDYFMIEEDECWLKKKEVFMEKLHQSTASLDCNSNRWAKVVDM